MLDFESPNAKPNIKRNLQCQPTSISMKPTSPTSASTAEPRIERSAQKNIHSCTTSTGVTTAACTSTTLISAPLNDLRIFFKDGIASQPIFPWVQISRPSAPPAPKTPMHQEKHHLMLGCELGSPAHDRNLTNKILQPNNLAPTNRRKHFRVMPVRNQPQLRLAQSSATTSIPEPRHRAPVMHQHDISNRSDQFTLPAKKMPPGVNRTAPTAQARWLRSGRNNEDGREARTSRGLLMWLWLGAIAVGRGAEYVGAQVVASDRAVGGLFDGAAMFSWGYRIITIQPVPNVRLRYFNHTPIRCMPSFNSFSQVYLSTSQTNRLQEKNIFHAQRIPVYL